MACTQAAAGPPPAVGGPLLDEIASMPPGTWKRVNRTLFSTAWTPPELRPLKGLSNPAPFEIIQAWSGFAWDSRRGNMIIFGGGHANYAGNDVYFWLGSTMGWERASLPSEVKAIPGTVAMMPIDGPDAGPGSAHTYDNNIFLPIADRFLAFGGALYNTGGAYIRPDEAQPDVMRRTGPYAFDPARADANKVGGSTGSHVQRVGPYPEIVGGTMWANRDIHLHHAAKQRPARHVNGCTAYAEENGVDVVYVAAPSNSSTALELYRYSLPDVANPAGDTIDRVGSYWAGTTGQTACGYDPQRRLFVRTGNNTYPFLFWSLVPGTVQRDQRVETNASIAAFVADLNANGQLVEKCGLDFDPADASFAIWCGGGKVWKLRSPATNVASGWTIALQPTGGEMPFYTASVGVLGKWDYVPGFDVFMGLEDEYAGNVYVYKPAGWDPPEAGDPVNWMPSVSVTSPAGATVEAGEVLALEASAYDRDGTIALVEYRVNGKRLGASAVPPYTMAWTAPSAGTYAIEAKAIDDGRAEGRSAPLYVTVLPPNVRPSVTMTAPAAGAAFAVGSIVSLAANASDSDGTIANVEFFANGVKVGEDAGSPYAASWTPGAAGSYTLTARATDDRSGSTVSSAIQVSVVAANQAPAVALTAPGSGTTHTRGVPISLAANASDSDGSVSLVEFFANDMKIGEDAASPFQASWTPSQAGTFVLKARARDNLGATTESTTASVSVVDPVGMTTLVVQQGANGYAGTVDTTLSSYRATSNYGASTLLQNYYHRYTNLVRFAVFDHEGGSVPSGAVIHSATVELYSLGYPHVYRLHRMLKAWDELTATWQQARAGSPWTVAGAQGAGTDYASAHDAEFSTGWGAGWLTFDVTDRIRSYASGVPNLGWRIVNVSGYNGSVRRIPSSESGEAALRPRLTIVYSEP